MTIVAEVWVSGTSTVLGPTLSTLDSGTITQQYQATGDTFTFAAEGCDFQRLERSLAEDPTVANPRLLTDMGETRIYRVDVAVDRPVISEIASELDVQIVHAVGRRGGWQMRLRLPDRELLKTLLETMEGYDLDVQVRNLFTDPERGVAVAVTPAQREALVTAFELGYFEQPREASLEEVAAELGISSSAVSGRINRGMRTVVEEVFVDHG